MTEISDADRLEAALSEWKLQRTDWTVARMAAEARALVHAELVAMAFDGLELVSLVSDAVPAGEPGDLIDTNRHHIACFVANNLRPHIAALRARIEELKAPRNEPIPRNARTIAQTAQVIVDRLRGEIAALQAKVEAAERERDRMYDQILDRLDEAAHALIQKKRGIALDIIEEARAALGGDNG